MTTAPIRDHLLRQIILTWAYCATNIGRERDAATRRRSGTPKQRPPSKTTDFLQKLWKRRGELVAGFPEDCPDNVAGYLIGQPTIWFRRYEMPAFLGVAADDKWLKTDLFYDEQPFVLSMSEFLSSGAYERLRRERPMLCDVVQSRGLLGWMENELDLASDARLVLDGYVFVGRESSVTWIGYRDDETVLAALRSGETTQEWRASQLRLPAPPRIGAEAPLAWCPAGRRGPRSSFACLCRDALDVLSDGRSVHNEAGSVLRTAVQKAHAGSVVVPVSARDATPEGLVRLLRGAEPLATGSHDVLLCAEGPREDIAGVLYDARCAPALASWHSCNVIGIAELRSIASRIPWLWTKYFSSPEAGFAICRRNSGELACLLAPSYVEQGFVSDPPPEHPVVTWLRGVAWSTLQLAGVPGSGLSFALVQLLLTLPGDTMTVLVRPALPSEELGRLASLMEFLGRQGHGFCIVIDRLDVAEDGDGLRTLPRVLPLVQEYGARLVVTCSRPGLRRLRREDENVVLFSIPPAVFVDELPEAFVRAVAAYHARGHGAELTTAQSDGVVAVARLYGLGVFGVMTGVASVLGSEELRSRAALAAKDQFQSWTREWHALARERREHELLMLRVAYALRGYTLWSPTPVTVLRSFCVDSFGTPGSAFDAALPCLVRDGWLLLRDDHAVLGCLQRDVIARYSMEELPALLEGMLSWAARDQKLPQEARLGFLVWGFGGLSQSGWALSVIVACKHGLGHNPVVDLAPYLCRELVMARRSRNEPDALVRDVLECAAVAPSVAHLAAFLLHDWPEASHALLKGAASILDVDTVLAVIGALTRVVDRAAMMEAKDRLLERTTDPKKRQTIAEVVEGFAGLKR